MFSSRPRKGSINTGVHGGSRTIAGAFGAKAAKLMEYTDSRHYGVQLSVEDRHRKRAQVGDLHLREGPLARVAEARTVPVAHDR